jgi:hypothetical protein
VPEFLRGQRDVVFAQLVQLARRDVVGRSDLHGVEELARVVFGVHHPHDGLFDVRADGDGAVLTHHHDVRVAEGLRERGSARLRADEDRRVKHRGPVVGDERVDRDHPAEFDLRDRERVDEFRVRMDDRPDVGAPLVDLAMDVVFARRFVARPDADAGRQVDRHDIVPGERRSARLARVDPHDVAIVFVANAHVPVEVHDLRGVADPHRTCDQLAIGGR